jgi:hypothetical protein
MLLLQYFGWAGGFLFAALLAVNWCFSAPIALAPHSDVPFNQRINIRIHTEHKWPERVVFDTTRSLAQRGAVQTDLGGREAPVLAERQLFDAFAEMAAMPVRPCFRPPCSAGLAAAREVSPIRNSASIQDRSRPSTVARKRLTFPNRLHKPQERS